MDICFNLTYRIVRNAKCKDYIWQVSCELMKLVFVEKLFLLYAFMMCLVSNTMHQNHS